MIIKDKKEIWKDISEYEGLYQISNYGQIKSLNYNHTNKEKNLKLNINKKKYLYAGLYKNGKRKIVKSHRMVAIHFLSNHYNKLEVNHKDGNKQNNYYKNLEWATAKENNRHAELNNLSIHPKGEKHGCAKLTEKQVLEIRNIYPQLQQIELAKKYNVAQGIISAIINKKIWKHI